MGKRWKGNLVSSGIGGYRGVWIGEILGSRREVRLRIGLRTASAGLGKERCGMCRDSWKMAKEEVLVRIDRYVIWEMSSSGGRGGNTGYLAIYRRTHMFGTLPS